MDFSDLPTARPTRRTRGGQPLRLALLALGPAPPVAANPAAGLGRDVYSDRMGERIDDRAIFSGAAFSASPGRKAGLRIHPRAPQPELAPFQLPDMLTPRDEIVRRTSINDAILALSARHPRRARRIQKCEGDNQRLFPDLEWSKMQLPSEQLLHPTLDGIEQMIDQIWHGKELTGKPIIRVRVVARDFGDSIKIKVLGANACKRRVVADGLVPSLVISDPHAQLIQRGVHRVQRSIKHDVDLPVTKLAVDGLGAPPIVLPLRNVLID